MERSYWTTDLISSMVNELIRIVNHFTGKFSSKATTNQVIGTIAFRMDENIELRLAILSEIGINEHHLQDWNFFPKSTCPIG